jgi:hypothetical protein
VTNAKRPTIGVGQTIALTLFLATAIVLAAWGIAGLTRGSLDWSAAAFVITMLAAAVACVAMLSTPSICGYAAGA